MSRAAAAQEGVSARIALEGVSARGALMSARGGAAQASLRPKGGRLKPRGGCARGGLAARRQARLNPGRWCQCAAATASARGDASPEGDRGRSWVRSREIAPERQREGMPLRREIVGDRG